ncbi:MAG: hypothetical protein JSV24_04760 [Bacteroidales bacterium]|nr:MAG: hypothetical protein JSV24_04760 [Bacteroidales bacterium]
MVYYNPFLPRLDALVPDTRRVISRALCAKFEMDKLPVLNGCGSSSLTDRGIGITFIVR